MFDLEGFKNHLDSWVESTKLTYANDTLWTQEIKNILVKMAPREPGIEICARDVECDWGEWVCDVSWLRYSGDNYQRPLLEYLLAVECEWGNWGDVLDDFEKLVVCRANTRVMIFEDVKEVVPEKAVDELKGHAASFKDIQEKDHFIFARYANKERKFLVEEWYFQG